MLRRLLSGLFLLVLMLPSAGAQEFEARYHGIDSSVAADPAATRTLADFVSIVSDVGLYDLALTAIERHLSRHPFDSEAELIAAQTYRRLGNDELAAQHAQQALQSGRLDDIQLRRAAFLRAAIEPRAEIPTLLAADLRRGSAPDPVASAGVRRISRDRLHPARTAELDESVLRRIYGEIPRATDPAMRISAIAPAQAKELLPSSAIVDNTGLPGAPVPGRTGPENYLAYQESGPVSATVQPEIDLSLRYTFALY